jgi:bifunctional DNase/RNase
MKNNLAEVIVSGLALDVKNNSPVVILKEKEGERILPIWIGVFEANAIAMALAGVQFKRPLTYDLLHNILLGLEAKVDKIVVSDLKENTYFAKVFIQSNESVIEIDARPSDSIALALKTKSPLFVEDTVLENFSQEEGETGKYSADELRERLKKINPEDFGDFKL